MLSSDTIFAQATPNGHGAISIIRISGKDCFKKLSNIFRFANKKVDFKNIQSHSIYFGHIIENNDIVDEALLSIFKSPKSYTKEDSAEISFHGSPYISQKISILLIENGIRQAKAGEFTMRAFMNGRFDLSQAEAVADIISSHSEESLKLALKQFRGDFSKKIEALRDELIKFLSLIELELDFSEEDVEFADRNKLLLLLNNLIIEISNLRNSFSQGNVIKQGIPIVITGRPNAGKSTLLNLLVKDDKALVSEIPGTTRDSLEDIISIDGITFRFIDTAGIRQTEDTIEKLGIERTMKMISSADIILYIADLSEITSEEINTDISELKNCVDNFDKKKLIIIGNKTDLLIEIPHNLKQFFSSDIIFISAKRNENIELIEDILKKTAGINNIQDKLIVSNTRHYQELLLSEKALKRCVEGINKNISIDLLSSDLRDAMFHLGSITGKITNDDILDSIFKNFCIGK